MYYTPLALSAPPLQQPVYCEADYGTGFDLDHFARSFGEGDFRTAKFSNTLRDINIGPDGTVYILDCGNLQKVIPKPFQP